MKHLPALLPLLLIAACTHAEPAPTPAKAAAPTCDANAPLSFERSPGGVPEVSPEWLEQHRCRVRVVDVREAEELVAAPGHLPGVTWAPLESLEQAAHAWRPDEPIVLVCRSGRRSAQALRRLEQLGFSSVASLSGGMLLWGAHDKPTSIRPDDLLTPLAPAGLASYLAATHPDAPRHAAEPLERTLARPDAVRWVKAAALVMEGAESCVDGRNPDAVLGTPGGDAGEFVLALAAIEQASGQTISEAQIAVMLDRYMESFGRFYMHTDTHALEALAHDLERDPAMAQWRERLHDDIVSFVRHPPRGAEAKLLNALASAEHVGCGHLRLQLQHPEQYGVRAALVQDFMRVFFKHKWSAPGELTWDILDGGHAEEAVVQITVDEPVHAFTRIPALAPERSGAQVFVVHPQVADYMRKLHIEFFIPVAAELSIPLTRERFSAALAALAQRQQDATLGHLAKGLPSYSVQYDPYSSRVVHPPRVLKLAP